MSRSFVVLENVEGQLGKPMVVQGDPEYIKYAVARDISDILRNANSDDLIKQPPIHVLVFEKTEECLPFGDHLFTVYRQVTVDRKADR